MKKSITKLKMNRTFKSLFIFAIALMGVGNLTAQAPWCTGQHRYFSGYSSTGYLVALEQVRISSGGSVLYNKPADGCNVTTGSCGSEWKLVNGPSNSFDITAGNSITIEASASTSYGYSSGVAGAFIDFNNDKDFNDAGEYLGTWTVPCSGTNTPAALASRTFNIPCNITPSATRLRVVMNYQYENMTPGHGCSSCSGGPANYGESEDYSINLVLPTSVSANFVAPSTAFVKTVINFINSNQKGYTEHAWDANNDGSWEQKSTTPDYKNSQFFWSSPGTKCVKLRSTNCLGRDSVVKCFNVVAPTQVPVADFIASTVVVEQYNAVQFSDLSTNGPWQWMWDIYDSTTYLNDVNFSSQDGIVGLATGEVYGAGFSEETKQNPVFYFDLPGKYTVELVATNDVGPSNKKRKLMYIECIAPTQYSLGFGTYGPNGDNVVGSSTGTIFDNGGPNLNYGNNQGLGTRSFLQITPCNATKINLTMTRLKFKDAGDILKVYDGKNAAGTLLASWTAGDKAVQKVSATSGSMYILFTSDASGVDSGFAGFYTSELGPATLPTPSYTTSTSPGYNSTPLYFTNTTQGVPGVATWEWTVDGASVPNNTKKDFKTTFTADGKYEVCLTVRSCVGNNVSCDTVEIITPNTQTSLDFTASNRRPTINVSNVTLKPQTDKANRFSWTIFPTTYTLMNPPTSPSNSGVGFVNYKSIIGDSFPTPIIKFTASGCYTITLKAWSALDSANTVKTVVKNKYICALDYCSPSSYILSSDVGINRVRVLDGTNELINNFSTSGVSAYTDYSTMNQATLTFGKTYTVEVSRNTTVDPANRVGYVDWNIDGDFDDAGEQIFMESAANTSSYTANFTVPEIAKSFEGLTRLRVAINYNNNTITPCGPLTAGEYEDYGLILKNDNLPPMITLNGSDTVRIERCAAYIDAGAVAMDPSEGDISYKMVKTSDLDSCTTGIYSITYDVTDASGNKAASKTRTVIVVLDKTPPVLTITSANPVYIEADRATCSTPYTAPNATATDNLNGNISNAIVVTGSVDKCVLGTYTLNYYVQDVAGNSVSKDLTVIVRDTKVPTINPLGSENVQINSVWLDQTIAEDAYDLNPELTKDWGFNGPVNTLVKATYPVTYYAEDQSGNMAIPVVRNYKVDDYIPPTISLNTFDVVEHEVRTAYNSVDPSVSDNYYPANFLSITKISSDVNPNVLGTYTEVFEAVDGSGNTTQKTRTVKVVDPRAPQIWGPIIHGCVGEDIWPMWEISTTDNYYDPATLKPLVEIVNQNVNKWEEGIYTISYRVTDPSGNTSNVFTRMVQYTYWPKCFNSTVSTDKIETLEEKVSVYPNPTNGLVTIDLNGTLARNTTVEVYNAMGQVISTQVYNEAIGKFEINLAGEASGVYTVKLITDGQVVTKRVVVSK